MAIRAILPTALCLLAAGPLEASTFLRPSFWSSVQVADAVVLARVTRVVSVSRPADGQTAYLGQATLELRLAERLKGEPAETITVEDLDLGDGQGMRSPYPPIQGELVGRNLLLMLRQTPKPGVYQAVTRAEIQDARAVGLIFEDLAGQSQPLDRIRAAVAELVLIQRACPVAADQPPGQAVALAACRTGLYSTYAPVVAYVATQLLRRGVPSDFLPDVLQAVGRADVFDGAGEPLVRCVVRIKDISAADTLIDLLEAHPGTPHLQEGLQALTGQSFGDDVVRWRNWWSARKEPR